MIEVSVVKKKKQIIIIALIVITICIVGLGYGLLSNLKEDLNSDNKNLSLNIMSKIPIVSISTNNNNVKVSKNTNVKLTAKFIYYTNNDYYFRWNYYNNKGYQGASSCMKMTNGGSSQTILTVKTNNQVARLDTFSDSGCKKKVSSTFSKTYNVENIPYIITDSSTISTQTVNSNYTKRITLKSKKNSLSKRYYKVFYYKNGSLNSSSSCYKMTNGNITISMKIDSDYHFAQIQTYSDNKCKNLYSAYYTNTYVKKAKEATSLSLIGTSLIGKNKTIYYLAFPSPSDSVGEVKWTSSNKSVVTINEKTGEAKTKKGGTSKICATLVYNTSVKKCIDLMVEESALYKEYGVDGKVTVKNGIFYIPTTKTSGSSGTKGSSSFGYNKYFYARLNKLIRDAKKYGHTITASTGDGAWRSYDRQSYYYQCYLKKNCNNGNYASAPGTSTHGWGIASDLKFSSKNAIYWAHDNASKYGLAFPYCNNVRNNNDCVENWHIEPRYVYKK